MKILKAIWGLAILLTFWVSAATQAAQWVNTSGTTVITNDQVTLVGSATSTSRADILNIPVVAGQSYTLGGQISSSVAGNWTYIGLVNGSAITERGASSTTYSAITPITFTAASNTISVYGSFWVGQSGNGLVKAVTLNGAPVIAASSVGYAWVNASGTTSVSGDLLTLTASTAVSRGEIRNVAVTAGQSYTITGEVYNSTAGYNTYIGVVNGAQTVEHGGNWSSSTAVAPITFTAQGNTITVYGSFWTGQAGNGYVHNVQLNGVALIGGSSSSGGGSGGGSGSGPCSGTYIFCDDFSAATIDTTKWVVLNGSIGAGHPVSSANIALTTVNDNGTNIRVVDSMASGNLHGTGVPTGGILMSKNQLGGGRYEVRMKNLPGPNGCSCFWNYYDSLNEASPPPTRIYTEIDIEMPGHEASAPAWATWEKILGFNTWSHTDADADATYILHPSTTVNPFDGQFHIYRFDWYDGTNGSLRIDWYVDNILQASTTQHVNNHPAILYVGNWPAPWAGMTYNFDTVHMYINWVRVSAL